MCRSKGTTVSMTPTNSTCATSHTMHCAIHVMTILYINILYIII